MNYAPNDFIRLMSAVEELGGTNLPDACRATKYRLKVPGPEGKQVWEEYHTTGCGQETRFVVLYDPQEPVDLADTDKLPDYDFERPPNPDERAALIAELPMTDSPEVTDANAQLQTDRGAGYAVICAVDDDMGKWPKFKHLMQEGSY